MPSVCGQPTARATCVVCSLCAVFCAMGGCALCGEERSDCGRGARTYVALTFALGSEPPPAIVRYVCRWVWGGCDWWWWVER